MLSRVHSLMSPETQCLTSDAFWTIKVVHSLWKHPIVMSLGAMTEQCYRLIWFLVFKLTLSPLAAVTSFYLFIIVHIQEFISYFLFHFILLFPRLNSKVGVLLVVHCRVIAFVARVVLDVFSPEFPLCTNPMSRLNLATRKPLQTCSDVTRVLLEFVVLQYDHNNNREDVTPACVELIPIDKDSTYSLNY